MFQKIREDVFQKCGRDVVTLEKMRENPAKCG